MVLRAVAPDPRHPDDPGGAAASEGIHPLNVAAALRRRSANVDVEVPWDGNRPAVAVPFRRHWENAGDAVPWDEIRENAAAGRRRWAEVAGEVPMETPDAGVADLLRGEMDGGEGDCMP